MDEYLQWILENFRFPDRYAADRMLKKHYETTFGIFNHRDPDKVGSRPWVGMACLPGNSPGKNYIYEGLLPEYHRLRIKDILGLTFFDFLELTPAEMKAIRVQCEKISRRKEEEDHQKQTQEDRVFKDISKEKPLTKPRK